MGRRTRAIAGSLAECGVLPGDIVPVTLDNGCNMAAAVLGALASGARPLLLAPGLTASERQDLLRPWGIRVALADVRSTATWRTDGSPGEPIEVPDSPIRWESFALAHDGSCLVRHAGRSAPGDMGSELLIPTSGSTGTPKIVRLSESGTVWNAQAHMKSVGVSGADRILIVTPLHHAATLVAQFMGAIAAGASVVFSHGPFSARGFWEAVVHHSITSVALTPTHVQMILARPQAVPHGPPVLLRRVTVGSAPVASDTLQAFAALLAGGCAAAVQATYGLSEAGPRVTTLPAARVADKGASVGLPLEGISVRIADPQYPDRPLPTGHEGELQVMTPSRMLGYLGEPPCEAEWLRTGDLGVIDAEGFVTLSGRLKELIVSGGVNVSPVEVEHALCRDARVREAAVTGEPHPLLGEIVRAYVVVASPVDEHALLATLAGHLASYKLPRKVNFLEALPRTATGKVDKRRLRDLAEPS